MDIPSSPISSSSCGAEDSSPIRRDDSLLTSLHRSRCKPHPSSRDDSPLSHRSRYRPRPSERGDSLLASLHKSRFRPGPSERDDPPPSHRSRFRPGGPSEKDYSPPSHRSRFRPSSSTKEIPPSTLRSPSPPTHAARAMRTLDLMSSPDSPRPALSHASHEVSTPGFSNFSHKAHLYFDEDEDQRRTVSSSDGTCSTECDSTTNPQDKSKSANINPFTPSAMKEETKKRRRSKRFPNSPASPLSVVSQQDLMRGCESPSGGDDRNEGEKDENTLLPSKRVGISDISITRYNREFLEVDEIASGEFGVVKKARHRLDGIVYAIKMTKNENGMVNSRDERVAMNEVFAHAALMKHKHVVRYYNSWVEHGQVYIQNEYCEGGSLANQIEQFRRNRTFFTEDELKKLLVNVAKGLQYIHSKELVHLDIKPGNIFISLDNYTPSSPCKKDHSTDSDVALDQSLGPLDDHTHLDENDTAHYKIGDLGHVSPIFGGEISPEEGDCRYMAPEFLEMEVDRSRLAKADIFSLGLTVFEAACLRPLPKNSLDDPDYEKIKRGDLPYLNRYSREFNSLVRILVNPDPSSRPSAHHILSNSILNPGMNKTRSQLYKELKETREKLLVLEKQVMSPAEIKLNTSIMNPEVRQNTSVINMNRPGVKRLAGRGASRSMSCSM